MHCRPLSCNALGHNQDVTMTDHILRRYIREMSAIVEQDGRQRNSLLAVFPRRHNVHTTPTPIATPDLSSTVASQSFSGLTSPSHQPPLQWTAAQLQIKRNFAWSTATRFLRRVIEVGSGSGAPGVRVVKTNEVEEALDFLLSGAAEPLPDEYDLFVWFQLEARLNFERVVGPQIGRFLHIPIRCEEAFDTLRRIVHTLATSYGLYRETLIEHILPAIERNDLQHATGSGMLLHTQRSAKVKAAFEQTIHEWFVRSFYSSRLYDSLSFIIYDCLIYVFHIRKEWDSTPSSSQIALLEETSNRLLQLFRDLHSVGLGGGRSEITLSVAVERLLDAFIDSPWMKVDWIGATSAVPKLRTWISQGLVPFLSQAVQCLNPTRTLPFSNEEHISRLEEIAISKLASARNKNLFDFILGWPFSLGAILDIKECIGTSPARSRLIYAFDEQLHRRLLHAGATTTNILNVYIYVIRAFAQLDPKGALINRAIRPIQHYLKSRTDTAEIIVSSMLVDLDIEKVSRASDSISVEIAKEMQKPIANLEERDLDLNWDDMSWVPDPIDAGPEFQRTKVEDVFGHVFRLFERDTFIDVLKSILGEHLLRSHENSDFSKEIKLLELFKLRLGEEKLQACEVMLHDLETSRRTNLSVHQSEAYKANTNPGTDNAETSAQILSSFFWPTLKDSTLELPQPMKEIQDRYARGFESSKGSQSELQWMNGLGQVQIELELKGRLISETVEPLHAAVITLFDEDYNEGRNRASAIADALKVAVEDVIKALNFWITKGVIRSAPNDPALFEVIEYESSMIEEEASASVEIASNAQNAMLSAPNAEVYANYIISMLTANGNLPVARIAMMLKMTMPGGFPFNNDDLIGFLDALVTAGKLRSKNTVYGVKKAGS